MMEEVGIPSNIQQATVDNHEPNAEGTYTRTGPTRIRLQAPREFKIVQLFERHRNAAIHWFQNGHPMKSWITDSEGMLGVNEKQAKKISQEWYNIKRRETSALWAIHKGCVVPMNELRAHVADGQGTWVAAVSGGRARQLRNHRSLRRHGGGTSAKDGAHRSPQSAGAVRRQYQYHGASIQHHLPT
jgi:hypothetical protein